MLIFYLILFIILVVSLFDNSKLTRNSKEIIVYALMAVLILFAGLRAPGIDRDYKNYQYYYSIIPEIQYLILDPKTYFDAASIEPTFMILASITKLFIYNGLPFLIFIYALISISLKTESILKISDHPLLTLLLYFSTIFLLQDMTQIRVGIALGFAFLSIVASKERKLIKYAIFIIIGIFFHYSVIFFAPIYFFNSKKINKPLYLSFIIIPIILYFTKFNPLEILQSFDFGLFSNKLDAYVKMQKWLKEEMNMFNFSIIIQIMLAFIFIYYADKSENKYTIILTKIFCIGIGVFYIFSFSPVIAFRSSELLTSVQIFLLPTIISSFRHKALGEILIIVFSLLHFVNQIIINNIFNPYNTIFS